MVSQDPSGTRVERRVIRTHRTLATSFLEINGSPMVTPDHPFLANGSWTDAGELVVGSTLRSFDGRPVDVLSLQVVRRGVRVYNISVDVDHTFFANGVLVHNKPPNFQG